MTQLDFDFLTSPEGQKLVETHLDDHPETVALRTRNPALATQIKFLQRAKTKLPAWFKVRAILPPLAFEQCSSEIAASSKTIFGKTCLDLTCGLGVDTFYLSKNFEKVVALERNPMLAKIARYNFEKMGVQNVEIITEPAEDFLAKHVGEPFDWVFADPARRDLAGRKMFLPEDCEPNLVANWSILRKNARQILVKYSPMFDIDAAAKIFAGVAEVSVISIGNECKEILLRWTENMAADPLFSVKIYDHSKFYFYEKSPKTIDFELKTSVFEPKYILEPDVSIYKSRMTHDFFEKNFPEILGFWTRPDGFYLAENLPEHCPTRSFQIVEQMDWQPKKVGIYLKNNKITRLNVVVRAFDLSAAEVRKQLKIEEGGEQFLILTNWGARRVCWVCGRG